MAKSEIKQKLLILNNRLIKLNDRNLKQISKLTKKINYLNKRNIILETQMDTSIFFNSLI